jgi:hypothetical protein
MNGARTLGLAGYLAKDPYFQALIKNEIPDAARGQEWQLSTNKEIVVVVLKVTPPEEEGETERKVSVLREGSTVPTLLSESRLQRLYIFIGITEHFCELPEIRLSDPNTYPQLPAPKRQQIKASDEMLTRLHIAQRRQ